MRRSLFILALLLTTCIINASAITKRALLIGLSTYPKYKQTQLSWNNIHGANDVTLIGNTLTRQGFAIATLTNQQATSQAIRKAFARLTRQTKPGDLVYIHFSGHGQPFEDRDGDETDGWDESIVPYNAGQRYVANAYDGRNHIIDDELNVYITNIRKKVGTKGFVYVVIDACYSGGMSKGDEEDSLFIRGTNVGFSRSGRPFVPRIDKHRSFRVSEVRNAAEVCYIEACRPYQTNTEIKIGSHYYGPLSYYINKVLSRTRLSANLSWVDKVRKEMETDRRLIKQNIVVERSEK